MPQTVTRGPESTASVSSATQERYVEKEIARLTPDAAPLVVMTRSLKKKSIDHFKPEWFEKDLPARWDQVNNGAGYASGATSVVVDNASYFSVADIINVPRTAEKMRVSAVNTDTGALTLARGVGSTAAAALVDNDDLQIIGNAYAEGADRGIPKSHQPTNPYNYTQIFRTPFGQTRTESKTRHYVGGEKELAAEKLVEHMVDLERAFWFGERNRDTSDTGAPRNLMGGVLFYATSNITDFGTTVTEAEMESFMQNVTTYTGSGPKRALFASGIWISQLSQIAAGRLQTVSDKNATFGISVTQWITGHGTLNIIKNPLFENGAGGVGYGGYAAALDVGKLTYYYLADDNTKLRKNIQDPGVDGYVHEYLTECSLGFKNPSLHGIAKGLT
jgi:hypothetical protein